VRGDARGFSVIHEQGNRGGGSSAETPVARERTSDKTDMVFAIKTESIGMFTRPVKNPLIENSWLRVLCAAVAGIGRSTRRRRSNRYFAVEVSRFLSKYSGL